MKNYLTSTKNKLITAIVLLGLHFISFGQAFVYDGFDAPAGQGINTTSSGIGWSSAWFEIGGALGNTYANSPSLSYMTLQKSGNLMGSTNYSERTSRSFSVPGILDNGSGYLGKPGTVVYMSFLFKKIKDAAGWYNNGPVVQLINSNESLSNYDNNINKLGVGSFSDKKVLQLATGVNNGLKFDGTTTFNYGEVIFVVVKYTFNASSTKVDVFQNPNDALPEPNTASFSQTYNQVFSFNGIYFALGSDANGGALDEIRLAQTWDDVTPTLSVVSLDGVNILPSNAINTNGGSSLLASTLNPSSGTGNVIYKWSVSDPNGLYIPIVDAPTVTGIGVKNGTYTLTLSVTGLFNTVVQTSSITVSNQTTTSQLLAYEGFDYPINSTILGLNNLQSGWNGGWLAQSQNPSQATIINATALGYNTLSTSGFYLNRGESFGGINRRLDMLQTGNFSTFLNQDNIIGRKGKTMYTSFLLRRNSNDDMQFIFANQTDGTFAGYINSQNDKLGVVIQNNGLIGLREKRIFDANSNNYSEIYALSNRTITVDSTYFIVVSHEFNSLGDIMRVFVNPSLTGPLLPSMAVAQVIANVTANTAFSSISYVAVNQNSYDIDEIRFGTTYESVSPYSLIALQSATIGGSNSLVAGGMANYAVLGYSPSIVTTPVSTVWHSSNLSVATINGMTGALTALAAGTTSIYAVHDNPAMAPITSNGISLTVTSLPIALQTATIVGSTTLVAGGTTSYSVIGYSPNSASTPLSTIWHSSNTTVATIDGTSGALTALMAGTTTIYAVHDNPAMAPITSNGISLTVTSAPIALQSATIIGSNSLIVGGTSNYTVVGYSPLSANTPVSTMWYSSNMAVATINGMSGALTALSAGTTTIFAVHNNPAMVSITSNGISLTVTSAAIALQSATISGTSNLLVGSSSNYALIGYTPISATSPVSTMWYSSNKAVATIDGSSGALTALSDGTTSIYTIHDNPAMSPITSNGISLTVTSPIALQSATITGTNTLTVGGMATYSVVNYSPSNASTPVSTVWYSSNKAVATINGSSGALTALSAGTTNIYAIHNNPAMVSITSNGISLTVVTVNSVSLPIALQSATITGTNALTVGGMATYTVVNYSPSNASTPVSTVWYSSNKAVATINGSSGALTALSAGTTNIYAIHNNPANTTIMSNMIALTVSTVTSTSIKGVDNIDVTAVKVYPNPASDVIMIDIPSQMEVTAFDMIGKKVPFKNSLSAGLNEINITDLKSGVYFLKLSNGTNQIVKKMIVK